jgi:hypothetical protein
MAGQTLPWWLEGKGVKTTDNKIRWAPLGPVGPQEFKFSENPEMDLEQKAQITHSDTGSGGIHTQGLH